MTLDVDLGLVSLTFKCFAKKVQPDVHNRGQNAEPKSNGNARQYYDRTKVMVQRHRLANSMFETAIVAVVGSR